MTEVEQELRQCLTCKEAKPLEDFVRNKKGKGGRKNYCRVCHNEAQRAHVFKRKTEDPEQWRLFRWEKHIKSAYGLTPEDYWSMAEGQNHKCAICGTNDNFAAKVPTRLYVDHCHKTGKVRSLLCYHCNSLLGLCKEDKKILEKAIDYLNQHN